MKFDTNVDQAIQIKDAINDYLEKHPKVDVKAGSKALISNLGWQVGMEVHFHPMADGADTFYVATRHVWKCAEF